MTSMALRTTIKLKLTALLLAGLILALAAGLVRQYFYILDAYYYTAEFHVLFMVHNIGAAKIGMLKEYLGGIQSLINVLPALFLGHLIQGFWLPLSKPVLVAAADAALGYSRGLGMSFVALSLVGLLAYGLGRFFLGDILPAIQRHKEGDPPGSFPRARLLFGLGLAVPWVPVVWVAVLMALFKVPFKPTLVWVSVGLGLRVLLCAFLSGVS